MNTKVMIYGCGGAGINVVSSYDVPQGNGYPDTEKVYLDTSEANMSVLSNDDRSRFFKIKGMHGAGKKRLTSYSSGAVEQIPEFLLTAKPGTMNYVVFSLGGGSGSICGPLLVEELVSRGEAVMCIIVGDLSSFKTAENTLSTFKGLSLIPSNNDRALSFMYFENVVNSTVVSPNVGNEQHVDANIHKTLNKLLFLTSEQNNRIDRQDTFNFFDYSTVVDIPPTLTAIHFGKHVSEVADLSEKAGIVAMAALLKSECEPLPEVDVAYSTIGFHPEDTAEDNMYVMSVPTEANLLLGTMTEHVDRYKANAQSLSDKIAANNKAAVESTDGKAKGSIVL